MCHAVFSCTVAWPLLRIFHELCFRVLCRYVRKTGPTLLHRCLNNRYRLFVCFSSVFFCLFSLIA